MGIMIMEFWFNTKKTQPLFILRNTLQSVKMLYISPPVSDVSDLVGWHEEEHRGVEAPAHLLLPLPLLHQPHPLQVKPKLVSLYLVIQNCQISALILYFMLYLTGNIMTRTRRTRGSLAMTDRAGTATASMAPPSSLSQTSSTCKTLTFSYFLSFKVDLSCYIWII